MGNMRNHINTFTKSVKSAESVVNDLFDNCRESSTNRAFFCKTKPICRRCKIQVSSVVIKGYEGKARLAGISKQSQLKPKPMLRWVNLISHRGERRGRSRSAMPPCPKPVPSREARRILWAAPPSVPA